MNQITVRELLASDVPIFDFLPESVATVTQADARYHAGVRHEWCELNQIDTLRNRRFHQHAIEWISRDLPPNASILELGSGVGYDAAQLLKSGAGFGCYIVSEISRELLEYTRRHLAELPNHQAVRYCVMTATDIPIANAQVDRVFAVATLHHFPDVDAALSEIDRISTAGARIVFAIEPNRLWSAVMISLRPLYRAMLPTKDHSAADEEAEGFRVRDFRSMAAKTGWRVEQVQPVWFAAGFLHIGLEFFYRAFRLRRRVRVPAIVERLVLAFDDIFLRLPLCRHIAWHYTVVFRKPIP
jgi:ubiquinone/menaquinone biosynthesis C-methylase UbiE